jgi:electron transfer flavoprotein alpha/beta subunit
MASIIAYTEVRQTAITAASRFALAEARRIADDLGATVYALLALGPAAPDELAALAGEVGTAGADRILCCTDEALQGPSRDATHGPLLAAVAERLRPTLVLFSEGESGPELGRPLADRMGASFMPGSNLEILAATDLQLAQVVVRCGQTDQGQERVVGLHEIGRPVVVTLCAGTASLALGEPASEMEMLSYPTSPRS